MDAGNNNSPTPPNPLGGLPNYLPDYQSSISPPPPPPPPGNGNFPNLGDPRSRVYGNYNAPYGGIPKLPKPPGSGKKILSILASIGVLLVIIFIKVVILTAVRGVNNNPVAFPSFSVAPLPSFGPLPSNDSFGLPPPVAQAGTISGHGYNYPLLPGWQSALTAADKGKYDSKLEPSDNSLVIFDTEALLSNVSIKDQANSFATTDEKYNWTVSSVTPGPAIASEASYEIQEVNTDGNQRVTLVVSHAGVLYALDMEFSPTLKASASTTLTSILNGWKWSQ